MGTRYTVPTSPEWWGRDLDWWSAHDLAEVARDLLAGHCMRQIIFPVIELVPDRDSWANRPSGDTAAAQEKVGSKSHYSMSEVVRLWRLERQWRRDFWAAQV